MDKICIVIRESNYWVFEEGIMQAVRRFKRLTGKFPTEQADITVFSGESDEVDKIEISEIDGTVSYPKTLQKIKLQSHD